MRGMVYGCEAAACCNRALFFHCPRAVLLGCQVGALVIKHDGPSPLRPAPAAWICRGEGHGLKNSSKPGSALYAIESSSTLRRPPVHSVETPGLCVQPTDFQTFFVCFSR